MMTNFLPEMDELASSPHFWIHICSEMTRKYEVIHLNVIQIKFVCINCDFNWSFPGS